MVKVMIIGLTVVTGYYGHYYKEGDWSEEKKTMDCTMLHLTSNI